MIDGAFTFGDTSILNGATEAELKLEDQSLYLIDRIEELNEREAKLERREQRMVQFLAHTINLDTIF